MNPKTPKEYASDLKHFIGWFEVAGDHQEADVVFRIEDVAIPTLTRYRETMQDTSLDSLRPLKEQEVE
ncbi:hypothetical protein AYJ08_07725 [Brevibacillus sp. SKDU10]|uniref:hypothetical protein n=1 Tax=Brevibacillus sp. SKDU10 TaxID=1247872 RepID=UPI0007C8B0D6|nr:hypothetical protein [Brevibacillus sp. SKDU10]OAJ74727.1 hypothetical protein AYJ08_07725 [Brevibacillus sp. SKDU10]